jgi:hypothetical protein
MSNVRRVTKYEFEDGTDVEFVGLGGGAYDVRVNGVVVDRMQGAKPSELRAHYYHEVQAQELPSALDLGPADSTDGEDLLAVANLH